MASVGIGGQNHRRVDQVHVQRINGPKKHTGPHNATSRDVLETLLLPLLVVARSCAKAHCRCDIDSKSVNDYSYNFANILHQDRPQSRNGWSTTRNSMHRASVCELFPSKLSKAKIDMPGCDLRSGYMTCKEELRSICPRKVIGGAIPGSAPLEEIW